MGGTPVSARVTPVPDGGTQFQLGDAPDGGYPVIARGDSTPAELGYPPAETRVPPGWNWGIPVAETGIPPPSAPQNRRASTCYATGGTPLAVTQEDFLVFRCLCYL